MKKKLMPTAGFEPRPPDQKTSALPTRLPRHLMVDSSKSPFETYRFVPLKIGSIVPVLKSERS